MRSPKNLLLALFAFTTLATGILAWRQHLELISLRASAPVREQVVAASAAATATSEASENATASPAAVTDPTTAVSDSSNNALPSADPAPSGPRFTRRDAMLDSPEVQRLMMIQRKAHLDDRYAALFKSLGLRPEQLDRLKELLVERATVRNDVMGAARAQGINPRTDRDTIAALVRDGETEVDSAIRELLGETGFSQYQNYERTQPIRATVDRLEQRLSYTSTPLSSEQSAAMISLLDRAGAAESGRFGALPDVALEQARGVLAAPQLEALRQLQEEQRAQAEIGAAMRRQFETRRAGGNGPSD